jgi:mono/diheme cytochrome c family protein
MPIQLSRLRRKTALGALIWAAATPFVWGQQARSTEPPADARWELLQTYCTDCHNATDWAGGVAYDTMSPADVPHDTKLWEAAVRKLRGHLMPPPGNKQPTQVQADSVVNWLETSLDARKETPRAAHVTAQRLNRTEYANAVHSLLGIEIKVDDLLPPEIEMDGFDNIAAALTVSPSFLDQYIGAARFIAKRAVGSATAKMSKVLHQPAGADADDLPLGSNGGFQFTHFFPADGEYRLSILDDLTGGLYTNASLHRRTIVIFVDGKQVFRGDIGGKEDLGLADKEAATGRAKVNARFSNIPVKVTSGAHEVTLAWVERARTLSDENIGGTFGERGGNFGGSGTGGRFTAGVEVAGPFGATTIGDSPSRDKIMVCHPASDAEQKPCAEKIARNLAYHAYRRPVTDADVARLLGFFDSGRKDIGDFDGGVQEIVMAVLASPDFLYRVIQPTGDDSRPHPLSPLELASRLSFFLWSDVPDDELLQVAVSGKLADPVVYEHQVNRMLIDKRAAALVTGFAMRWLHVADLHAVDPDPKLFPQFNETLRQDFSTEIRLFLGDVLLGNKSVLELLSADYSFLNDRLARHYGMQGVLGSQFRRVQLSDPNRHGLLGKSAVLLRTSYGNRTSPVLRGAWVLDKLMGTPPTQPPPGVSTNLDPKDGARPTTLRERLELHRQAKNCNQCHGVIDPLGLALENLDVTGAWRTRDTGLPVNATSVLAGGVAVNGVGQLRDVLLARPDQFVQTMTERLLMYGTGRGVESSDMPQIRHIVHESAKADYRFFDLVMGIAKSDAFRLQAPPPDKGREGDKVQSTVAAAR